MNRMLMLMAGLVLAGCAGPTYMVNTKVTEDQARRDNFECKQQGVEMAYHLYGQNGAVFYGDQFMIECLEARGYHRGKR